MLQIMAQDILRKIVDGTKKQFFHILLTKQQTKAPENIVIAVLRGGFQTPNFGEGEAVGGQGWYRSKEHWWVSIGRP